MESLSPTPDLLFRNWLLPTLLLLESKLWSCALCLNADLPEGRRVHFDTSAHAFIRRRLEVDHKGSCLLLHIQITHQQSNRLHRSNLLFRFLSPVTLINTFLPLWFHLFDWQLSNRACLLKRCDRMRWSGREGMKRVKKKVRKKMSNNNNGSWKSALVG